MDKLKTKQKLRVYHIIKFRYLFVCKAYIFVRGVFVIQFTFYFLHHSYKS